MKNSFDNRSHKLLKNKKPKNRQQKEHASKEHENEEKYIYKELIKNKIKIFQSLKIWNKGENTEDEPLLRRHKGQKKLCLVSQAS